MIWKRWTFYRCCHHPLPRHHWEMSKTTVRRRLIYGPKPLEEITRVITRMWFLQESVMRMNGLHESNSKLNIRSHPKAKKTDSDLILLLCPPALCSRLSTFETLQCINHLRFIAPSRSQVHMDSLHVSFDTLGRVPFNICESWNTVLGCVYTSRTYTNTYVS